MPLSQFNALLTGCGHEPVVLAGEYLLIAVTQGICDVDFSDKTVILGGKAYSWAGSSTQHPEFAHRAWMYFVVPDEAVADMSVSDVCAVYTLKNHRPDAEATLKELTYFEETPYGPEEQCDFAIQEEWRLWNNANTGSRCP